MASQTSLLPKSEGEFAKKEFWEKFFKARGSKAFEWYGEYTSLVGILHRYVRASDRVLVVGCGNSQLSADLYDIHQCHNIVNVDISSIVIRQMTQKHCGKGRRPGMRYVCADVTLLAEHLANEKLSGTFACVVDKGTLDAMHSGSDSLPNVLKMFSEVDRAMNVGGRYMVVTLAQEHIVTALMEYFVKENPYWFIRCHVIQQSQSGVDEKGEDKEFVLPVFAIVMTKFAPSAKFQPIVEVEDSARPDKLTRLARPEDLSAWIERLQNAALVSKAFETQSEARCTFSCFNTGLVSFLCYLVKAKDVNDEVRQNSEAQKFGRKQKRGSKNTAKGGLPYAVFIVPIGCHEKSEFTGPEARQSLLAGTTATTLLVVMLNPRFYYTDSSAIQGALHSVALQFQPKDLPKNFQIPYLSSGSTYPCPEVSSTTLTTLGRCIVEECPVAGRRLVFPQSRFRPVQMTRHPACARDEHLSLWLELLTHHNTSAVSELLYYCPPKFTDRCRKAMSWACYLGDGIEGSTEKDLRRCCNQVISDSPLEYLDYLVIDPSGEEKAFDVLVYDPLSIELESYPKRFKADRLNSLAKTLNPDGTLVLLMESVTGLSRNSVADHLKSAGLAIVMDYEVKDDWLCEDPVCHVIIARKSIDSMTNWIQPALLALPKTGSVQREDAVHLIDQVLQSSQVR